jgi:predicted ATPase/DNA-binding SARP family transcriptional activator
MDMDTSHTLDVQLLGRFRLISGGQPVETLAQARLQHLFAYLLLHPDRAISRQQLAFAFWPDTSDDRARSNLRNLLHRLRDALPAGARWLEFDRHTVCWQPGATIVLDVAEFDAALARAAAAAQSGDATTEHAALSAAVALYTGDLLPDCYDDWIGPIRERLSQAALATAERLAQRLEEAHDFAAATTCAQRLLRADPLHEATYRRLMRLHALTGNRTGVVRAFNACTAALRQELGTAPEAETQAAYRAALDLAATPIVQPAAAARDARPGNLPLELTSLIGRERDLRQVHHLLAAHRLVTLTGAGGVGKTCLALRTAAEAQAEFPDGAWWADLASVADAELVTPTIAMALGVRERAGSSTTQTLADWLAPRRLLLVLDNCEHLAGRVGPLAQTLLRAAPQLRILVTSQRSLGVAGETAWRVPSLAVPPADAPPAAIAGAGPAWPEWGSVRLFVACAQAVLPTFTLTPGNAAAVAQICRRLHGIPLAIELAAARSPTLSPGQMVARLDHAFALLGRQSPPDAAAESSRQQTLWAALEWSHSLLAAPERRLFRRLAVFAGGFTLDAAETVCADPDLAADQVMGLLAGLEDRSLVEAEAIPGQRRFRLHETLQQYAAAKLAEAGETARLRAAHLAHFSRLALAAAPHLAGEGQAEWLDRLEAEHDNLRAALACSQTDTACAEIGLQIAGGLARFWATRGHFKEGRYWARTLLAAADGAAATPARLAALRAAAILAYYQADYAEAGAYYEQALAVAQALGDRPAIAMITRGLGTVAHGQGDCATALQDYAASLALCRELDDRAGEATALANLGLAAWQHGDGATGRGHLEACLALRQQLGDEVGIAYALHLLADIAWSEGRAVEAQSLNDESLAMRRRLGDKWGIAYSLDSLAVIAGRQGDGAQARTLFAESLLLFNELESRHGLSDTLEHLAGLLADEGSYEPATKLIAAAAALRAAIAAAMPPNMQREHDQQLARLHAQLGDERFRAAWLLGRALTTARAVGYALELTAV